MHSAHRFAVAALAAAGSLCFTHDGSAATENVNGIEWTYTIANGSVTLGGGTSSTPAIPSSASGVVAIPSELGGAPVTSIGSYAFSGCSDVTSFNIPDSVTSIGQYAFQNCAGLTAVEVPESVQAIGYNAFGGCPNLHAMTLPFVGYIRGNKGDWGDNFGHIFGNASGSGNGLASVRQSYYYNNDKNTSYTDYFIPTNLVSVTITDETVLRPYAFQNCSMLTNIVVNDEVTGIGSYAFSGCTRLRDFTIPASAKSIGSYAFSGCTGLTEITIPENVTSIGQYAFQNCSNLASIHILSTSLAIDQYAFSGCPASIYDTTTVPGVKLIDGWVVGFTDALSGEVDLSAVKNISQGAFSGNKNITSVVLPEGLTTIPYNAFNGCTSLRSVTIPDTVTRIDSYAFNGCTSLQNVVIPDTVTSIGSYAFYDCRNITAVNLPEGLKTIGEWAFYNTAIRTLSIPEGVTSVGQYAFYNCKSLTSVSFSASLTRIPDYAFQSCTKLASITLPEGVVSVGRYAFANCTGMKTVTLPTTLSSCGEYAFSGDTAITAVNISDLVAWCGIVFGNAEANPAYYAHALTLGGEVIHDLVIPDGLQKLNPWCFSDNYALTSVTVPDGIPAIPRSAFNRCAGITNAVLPESVADIGMYAFQSCNGLTGIDLPVAVTNIADYAFQTCTNLVEFVLPDSLESIGQYAFNGCSGLRSIVVPPSLHSVGNYAFQGCSAVEAVHISDLAAWCAIEFGSNGGNPLGQSRTRELVLNGEPIRDLILPDGVTQVKYAVFYNATNLTSATLPMGVASIGNYAFANCTSITNLSLPEGVGTIGQYAFQNCTGLTIVEVPEGTTSLGAYAFADCANIRSFTLPPGLKTIGDYAFRNCRGVSEIVIPEGVTSIGRYAFSGCGSLTRIVLPATITTIGENAFSGCGDLTVAFDDGATRIADGLFRNCGTAIRRVEFSDSLLHIGDNSFQNCSGLSEIVLPDHVQTIGYAAFYSCSALKRVVMSEALVSIGDEAFQNCGELLELVLPNTLQTIGSFAFAFCTNLTAVTMPKYIPIVLPEGGLEAESTSWGMWHGGTIQSGATPNNGSSSMTIRFTGAGEFSFDWRVSSEQGYDYLSCTIDGSTRWSISGETPLATKSLTLGDGSHTVTWRYYKDGSAYGGLDCGFVSNVRLGGEALDVYVRNLSANELHIGYAAFLGCDNISSVRVSDIRDWLRIHFGCDGYYVDDDGYYSENGYYDWDYGYYDYDWDVGYYWGYDGEARSSNPASLAGGLIVSGEELARLEVPDGTTAINDIAFCFFKNLASVTLPESVRSIGYRAFSDCPAIQSVTMPGVRSVALSKRTYWDEYGYESYVDYGSAFSSCPTIGEAVVRSDIGSMSKVFPDSFTRLQSVDVADGSTTVISEAFEGCSLLATVTLPETIAAIQPNAFVDCAKLEEIRIPSGVSDIADGAFLGATALKTISIAEGNENYEDVNGVLFDKEGSALLRFPGGKAGTYAVPDGTSALSAHSFRKSVAVERVEIPASVLEIGEEAFRDCTALKEIVVAADNPNFTSMDGVLYSQDGKTLIAFPGGFRGDFFVPGGVTTIAAGAFAGCDTLTEVTIPSSVRDLGAMAFEGCKRLANISLDLGLETIGDAAFRNCPLLTSLAIPESVMVIGQEAYMGCESLVNLTLPDHLPPMTVEFSGVIRDAVSFQRGCLYRITGEVVIESGASISIPSGVIVKFDPGVALYVYPGGTLRAQGTRASPVVFTSIRDDSFGGDTNGDGNSSSPGPGDWEEICNSGGTIEMSYAKVFYGGYGSWSNQGDAIIRTSSGTTTLDGCTIGHTDLRILGRSGGTVTARNTLLIDGRWGWDGNVRFVNGVVYDCSTGASGGTAVNTVFAECPTAASGATVRNCVASGCEAGTNAMTVADAKFADAANGDFRLSSGSPCIDAGDADAAPETDWYGQARVGTPDIGLHEWQPRPAQLDVDLEAVSVEVESDSAEVGDILSVDWSVRNAGSNPVSDEWRDTVELVSASGSVVELGTHRATGGILAGGRRSFRASYRIPSVEPGAARIRVKVNPHRDIYEGAATGNNVAYAEGSVEIRLPAWTPEESGGRMLAAGGSVALRVAAGSATAIRVHATGGEVSAFASGTGVPAGLRYDVAAETLPDGSLLLVLPKDADGRDYNVAIFNAGVTSASFQMEAVADAIAIESASPSRLANTGSGHLAVVGVGMDRVASARLEGPRTIDLADLRASSPARLSATADLSGAPVGTYSLVLVAENGATVRAAGAVEVYSPKMGPKLEAHLEIPGTVRQGRIYTGKIVYSNVGDTEMYAPFFMMTPTDASVRLLGEDLWQSRPLYVMGIAPMYPAGILSPGQTGEIEFEFLSGASPRFSLSAEQESALDWKATNAEFSSLLTRLNLRGRIVCNAREVYAYSEYLIQHPECVAISGTIVSEIDGVGLPDVLLIARHPDASSDDIESSFTAISDKNGNFTIDGLASGCRYVLEVANGAKCEKKEFKSGDSDLNGLIISAIPSSAVRLIFKSIPENSSGDVEIVVRDSNRKILTSRVEPISSDMSIAVDIAAETDCLEVDATLDGRFHAYGFAEFDDEDNEQLTAYIDFSDQTLLRGVVVDDESNPVEDADIAISDEHGLNTCFFRTGADGRFVTSGLIAGKYVIVSDKVGKSRFSEVVSIGEEEVFELRIVLATAKGYIVRGHCNDIGDGFVVQLLSSTGDVVTQSEIENGSYEISEVLTGSYTLVAVDEHLRRVSEPAVVVVDAADVTVDIIGAKSGEVSGRITSSVELKNVGCVFMDEYGCTTEADVCEDGCVSVVLPYGSYRWCSFADGCESAEGEIVVPSSENFTISLQPSAYLMWDGGEGMFTVIVSKNGQYVGNYFGETLQSGPLSAGTYDIVAYYGNGVFQEANNVRITAGESKKVTFTDCSRNIEIVIHAAEEMMGECHSIGVFSDSGIELYLPYSSGDVTLSGIPENSGRIAVIALDAEYNKLGEVLLEEQSSVGTLVIASTRGLRHSASIVKSESTITYAKIDTRNMSLGRMREKLAWYIDLLNRCIKEEPTDKCNHNMGIWNEYQIARMRLSMEIGQADSYLESIHQGNVGIGFDIAQNVAHTAAQGWDDIAKAIWEMISELAKEGIPWKALLDFFNDVSKGLNEAFTFKAIDLNEAAEAAENVAKAEKELADNVAVRDAAEKEIEKAQKRLAKFMKEHKNSLGRAKNIEKVNKLSAELVDAQQKYAQASEAVQNAEASVNKLRATANKLASNANEIRRGRWANAIENLRLDIGKWGKYAKKFLKLLDKINTMFQIWEAGNNISNTILSAYDHVQEVNDRREYFGDLYLPALQSAASRFMKAYAANYDMCNTFIGPPTYFIEQGGTTEIRPYVPPTRDPNEVVGPLGVGKERYVKPGESMEYFVYFENASDVDGTVLDIYVTNPLSEWLDWGSFEMGELVFNNQIDHGLEGVQNGSTEVPQNGTSYFVKNSVALDKASGVVKVELHIFDKTTKYGQPEDPYAGILPPNDETGRGEGHFSYKIKVRADAPAGVVITNSASIVFDYNAPIITDPAWFNTVATIHKPTVDLGDGTTTNLTLVVGQPYGELPTPAARAGYTFGGWYTGPNGTGTKITPTTIVQAGAKGIYPHWVQLTYTVAFVPNGGSGTMGKQTIAPGKSAKLSANTFSKQDNVFLGWATSANGEVVYADKAFVKDLAAVGQSVTFYAQWAVQKYSVKFSGNKGKLPKGKKMKTLAMTYGTAKKLPKNLFTRKGYVFLGWSLSKKGGTIYPNKASVKNLTTKGGTVTLHAQWAKKAYKVAFYANAKDAKGKMAAQAMTYGKAKKLSANKFTRKGYVFKGWAKSKADAKKAKVAYKNKKSVKNLITTGKTVKLYAVWKKK